MPKKGGGGAGGEGGGGEGEGEDGEDEGESGNDEEGESEIGKTLHLDDAFASACKKSVSKDTWKEKGIVAVLRSLSYVTLHLLD